jgi:adenylate cyclase
MGDGVNIAARLQGIAKPGANCLSEQAYWQVESRLDLAVIFLSRRRMSSRRGISGTRLQATSQEAQAARKRRGHFRSSPRKAGTLDTCGS